MRKMFLNAIRNATAWDVNTLLSPYKAEFSFTSFPSQSSLTNFSCLRQKLTIWDNFFPDKERCYASSWIRKIVRGYGHQEKLDKQSRNTSMSTNLLTAIAIKSCLFRKKNCFWSVVSHTVSAVVNFVGGWTRKTCQGKSIKIVSSYPRASKLVKELVCTRGFRYF